MKKGWSTIELGKIAELRGRIGWKGLTAKEYTKSGPRFLSVHSLNYGDYVDFRDAFHISQERYDESPEIMLSASDILICKDGAGIGKVGIVKDVLEPTTINSSLLLIRPSEKVVPKYLYFCLKSPYFQEIVQSRLEGATTPHLYQRDITSFPIVLPSLEEQQRIVAILDEAFEGLDRARANAETNLQSARELFDSVRALLLEPRNTGWTTANLSECFRFKSGEALTTKNMITGKIPVYGGNGIAGFHNEDNLSGENVVVGRVGALCGIARFIDEKIWLTDNAFKITEFKFDFDKRFLSQLLNFMDLRSLARQTAQPVISNSSLSDMQIAFPVSKVVQTEIATRLDLAEHHHDELKNEFAIKLRELSNLRQSLLQKAFAGELT